jgi:hypothetical protein
MVEGGIPLTRYNYLSLAGIPEAEWGHPEIEEGVPDPFSKYVDDAE